jgi:hypothetical protein
LGPFHPLFCSFQLEDQLSGPIVELLVKLMHHARQVLHCLHKFSVDWDVCTEHPKPGHLSQCSRIVKLFQHLLNCEVKWYIFFSEDVSLSGHSVASFLIQVLYSHTSPVGTTEDLLSQMTKSKCHIIGQVIQVMCKVT